MNDKEIDAILEVMDVLQEIVVALNCKEISYVQAGELTGRIQEAKSNLNHEKTTAR